MINRLCYTIILLLLLTSPIAAQDDESPFPVLDEAAIFADGVTVIERLPILNLDNGVVNYYNPDTSEWEVYDYPAGVERLGLHYQERSDGTYLIISRSGNTAQMPYIDDKSVWIFSPENGVYEPAESICNLMKALPNEGRWYITKIDDEYHLCHNETGQMSRSLSGLRGIGFETVDCLIDEGISNSPDGKWLIFHNCYEQEHYYGAQAFFVYGYDTEADEFTYLGLTDYTQHTSVYRWINDRSAIYTTFSESFDNDVFGDRPEFVQAHRIFYEITFADDKPVMHRLFDINAISIPPTENGFMWIEQDPQPHPIYRYDFLTQERQFITTLEACAGYECDIRWDDENTLGIGGSAVEYPTSVPLYIYDKRIEAWVYENNYSDVLLVQAHKILMYSFEDSVVYLQSLDLNTFEITIHGTVSRSMVSPFGYPSSDKHYIVVDNWNNEIPMGVYDIEKDVVYPLLRDTAYPAGLELSYQISWQDDNSLIVELRDDYFNGNLVARWRVQGDALDEEQP
jgi:hypothetical protein